MFISIIKLVTIKLLLLLYNSELNITYLQIRRNTSKVRIPSKLCSSPEG